MALNEHGSANNNKLVWFWQVTKPAFRYADAPDFPSWGGSSGGVCGSISFSADVPSLSCLPPQDCLRACQEQIESLLETSLRQAQQHAVSPETKTMEEEVDLSCTPTDVRDVNI